MPPLPEIAEALRSPAALAVIEVVWVLAAGTWLLFERRSPVATIAWILALAALPVVGAVVYLLLGPRRLERKKVRMGFARRARSWHLAAWEQGEPSGSSTCEQLARLAMRLDVSPPETAVSLDLYADGDACYDAQVAAIAAARHHVHAEYFIFRPDRTGARLRDALAERARAGVEVRLLVDGAGSSSLSRRFLRPLLRAGGRVEWFNPLLLRRVTRPLPNFRTHRKILVCDGSVGFTGGMNVSDDHSRAARGDAAWRDTHLRIEGAAVHGLQLTFLEDWIFATGREAPSAAGWERLRRYFPPAPRGGHLVQVVASGPDQDAYAIEALYFAAVAGARERAWITTPYFVPPEPLLQSLCTAARRGVDVQLLVPAATDARVVDAAGRTYHDELQDAGVRIHLYGPPMIHAKTCVVDRDVALVGTANLDNRSFRLNFEVVAAVHGGPAVEELARLFDEDRGRSRPRGGREAKDPFGHRLLASAARLLAPQL